MGTLNILKKHCENLAGGLEMFGTFFMFPNSWDDDPI